MLTSNQSAKSEIIDNPIYQNKTAQLSLFRRNRSSDMEKPQQEEKTVTSMRNKKTSKPSNDDTDNEQILKNKTKSL